MPSILKVSDLAVSFNGDAALANLSFEIAAGDCLAIIGPNGAGKTVLLKALLGMVPYQGSIIWSTGTGDNGARGADARGSGGKIRLGYVPQKIDADKHLPVNFKNLLAAKAAVLGFMPKQAAADAADITRTVELTPKILETPVGHLSGGQFQRALIAFALLGSPRVLLFDEPTASIDVTGEQQIYDLIHRLQDERGITAIVVSHDLSFVNRYATKVLCLGGAADGDGELCFGPPEEALTPEVLEKLYGGKMKYVHHMHGTGS